MTPERELLREALKLAHEFVADPDKRAQVKVQLAMNGRPKLADMIDEAVRVSRALIALANAQPESTQQPTLLDVQDRIDRGDIEGARATFNAGIRFVPVEAPQQAVLDAYTRCAEIARTWGNAPPNPAGRRAALSNAILAARDALKGKP